MKQGEMILEQDTLAEMCMHNGFLEWKSKATARNGYSVLNQVELPVFE